MSLPLWWLILLSCAPLQTESVEQALLSPINETFAGNSSASKSLQCDRITVVFHTAGLLQQALYLTVYIQTHTHAHMKRVLIWFDAWLIWLDAWLTTHHDVFHVLLSLPNRSGKVNSKQARPTSYSITYSEHTFKQKPCKMCWNLHPRYSQFQINFQP